MYADFYISESDDRSDVDVLNMNMNMRFNNNTHTIVTRTACFNIVKYQVAGIGILRRR